MTREFLLIFSIIMELAMVMILLSRFLPRGLNRSANMLVGTILIIVQAGSLTPGDSAPHYLFVSGVEIATLLFIIWTAIKWPSTDPV